MRKFGFKDVSPARNQRENVDQYLDLTTLIVSGVDLAESEAAFDLWLLAHMLETYQKTKDEDALKAVLAKEVGKPAGASKGKKRTIKVG